jgi:hypothetical protein
LSESPSEANIRAFCPLPSLQIKVYEILNAIAASLESLQLSSEKMQTSLEASTVIEEELLHQSEQAGLTQIYL